MRALLTALLATAPLLLAGCGDHQDAPTGPATVPDMVSPTAVGALRSTAIDPSRTSAADITLGQGGTVCSQIGLVRTGTFRCKSR